MDGSRRSIAARNLGAESTRARSRTAGVCTLMPPPPDESGFPLDRRPIGAEGDARTPPPSVAGGCGRGRAAPIERPPARCAPRPPWWPASPSRSRNLPGTARAWRFRRPAAAARDRKSTRLNSSHVEISYAVFCLKKKKKKKTHYIIQKKKKKNKHKIKKKNTN